MLERGRRFVAAPVHRSSNDDSGTTHEQTASCEHERIEDGHSGRRGRTLPQPRADFRGRPPFAPFALDAAAFAGLFACPANRASSVSFCDRPEHRHLSPLWGLYPGSEITPEGTPPLAKAAAVALDRRGTGGCGWSYGWKMGLRARLHDGDRALDQFRALLTRSSLPNLFSLCGRALQVDGNLGAAAAMAEMLVQSHSGVIVLLPALPAAWKDGSVQGLRARGAFDVDLAWSNGQPSHAVIRAHATGPCRVRVRGDVRVVVDGKSVRSARVGGDIVEFQAAAGRAYGLEFPATRR